MDSKSITSKKFCRSKENNNKKIELLTSRLESGCEKRLKLEKFLLSQKSLISIQIDNWNIFSDYIMRFNEQLFIDDWWKLSSNLKLKKLSVFLMEVMLIDL